MSSESKKVPKKRRKPRGSRFTQKKNRGQLERKKMKALEKNPLAIL